MIGIELDSAELGLRTYIRHGLQLYLVSVLSFFYVYLHNMWYIRVESLTHRPAFSGIFLSPNFVNSLD